MCLSPGDIGLSFDSVPKLIKNYTTYTKIHKVRRRDRNPFLYTHSYLTEIMLRRRLKSASKVSNNHRHKNPELFEQALSAHNPF